MLTWWLDHRPDVVTIMNSSLAGLVGITASANLMSPWQAALVGGVAAVVMQAVTLGLERLQIDDAVGAVPVHLGAGIWGNAGRRPPRRRQRLPDDDEPPGADRHPARRHRRMFRVGVRARLRRPVRPSTGASRSGSTGRESSGLNTPSMAPPRRSPICSETWTSSAGAAISRGPCGSSRTPRSVRSPSSTTACWRRSGVARIPCSCFGTLRPSRTASSAEDALAVVLEEVCRFTGWPIGHAFLASRDDPHLRVSTGIWHLSHPVRYRPLRDATEGKPIRAGSGLPGVALQSRQPIFVSSEDQGGEGAESES